MALGVGLGDHGKQFAWTRLGKSEGIAQNALDAGAGHYRDIGGCLDGMALVYASTYARVFAFRVFTHEDPVKVVDGAALERCVDAGKNAGGPHIGVLLEARTAVQEHAPQRDVSGAISIARDAETNGRSGH